MSENKDFFEELSVTELEERLELADRCLCRIAQEDSSPRTPSAPADTTTSN